MAAASLTNSFLAPFRSPLVALFASKAALVVNTHAALARQMPLLRGLLVVHEREALVFRHTMTETIDIPADRLCVHVSLGRRFKQKGTGLVHPTLLGR